MLKWRSIPYGREGKPRDPTRGFRPARASSGSRPASEARAPAKLEKSRTRWFGFRPSHRGFEVHCCRSYPQLRNVC